jgi:hypothetical protein
MNMTACHAELDTQKILSQITIAKLAISHWFVYTIVQQQFLTENRFTCGDYKR